MQEELFSIAQKIIDNTELEYELEVNTLTMENVLQNMYNYYMVHKLNKDNNIFSKMIKDGYSFIKIPRDMRDELLYELKIRIGEDKEEDKEKDTQEGL